MKPHGQHNADCVMADYIAFWDDGREELVRSVEFPDAGRPDIMKYSVKYGTVNICTKLVARELFDIIRFLPDSTRISPRRRSF